MGNLSISAAYAELDARFALSGRVVATDTNLPIARARIALSEFPLRPSTFETTTDLTGEYLLWLPGDGEHDINVSAAGYVRRSVTAQVTQPFLTDIADK